MEIYYAAIRSLHIACVIASGSLFAVRGLLALAGLPLARHIAVRALSWTIDTTLLTAALILTTIIRQYPFVNDWLTAKVLLLVVYVGLGHVALRPALPASRRAVLLAGAVAVFLMIVGIARTHLPLGYLQLLYPAVQARW